MTNDDLIIDVLAQLERDPSSWNQARWGAHTACGTAYCFAGWALALTGVPLRWDAVGGGEYEADHTADLRAVSSVAIELLGLTYAQSLELFHPTNSLDDLYRYAAKAMGVSLVVLLDKVQDRLAS